MTNSQKLITKSISDIFSLRNKTALITGASKGLGKAISFGFACNGAKVIMVSRSEERLIENSNLLKKEGYESEYCALDINNHKKLKKKVYEILNKTDVDILVNSAGYTSPIKSEDYPEELWDLTLNTNLKSVFILSQLI